VRRPGQNLVAVLFREVGREKRDAAQVETTIAEHREEHRVLPCCASDGDTEVRLGFRGVQDLDAIREHRRASLSGIKPAVIDFSDVRDEVGLDPARLPQDLGEMAERFIVRKRLELVCVLHVSCIARVSLPVTNDQRRG
jgi:hypothetical protein